MSINRMGREVGLRQVFFAALIAGLVLPITLAMASEGDTDIPLKVVGLTSEIRLGQPAWVKIENLDKWVRLPGHDTSKFVLCINGNELRGNPPSFWKGDELAFPLRSTLESKVAWNNVMCPPFRQDGQTVTVTVRNDNTELPGSASAPLYVISWFWLSLFVGILAAELILFLRLAYTSDVLREPGPQPLGGDEDESRIRKSFSLARVQMACWFFVVINSYVFIWMLTGDLPALPPSVLALIGISAATGLGSAVVDSGKRNDQERQHRILEEKKKREKVEAEILKSEIRELEATHAAATDPQMVELQKGAVIEKRGALAAKKTEIEHLTQKLHDLREKAAPRASDGFINDILNDDKGLSFHRFQMMTWTVVLIIIFTSSVYNNLVMQDFDGTLLALMGISSGTYIGFKMPSQQG